MHIQFAELPVFNQERAKNFYINHFDCKVAADVPMRHGGWRWIELKFAESETALHFIKRKNDDISDGPVLVLVDNDVAATVRALKSNGVKIISEPRPSPYQPKRTVAEFYDSEGNLMVLSSK